KKRRVRLCDNKILRDINLRDKADTAIQPSLRNCGSPTILFPLSFRNWRSTGSNTVIDEFRAANLQSEVYRTDAKCSGFVHLTVVFLGILLGVKISQKP